MTFHDFHQVASLGGILLGDLWVWPESTGELRMVCLPAERVSLWPGSSVALGEGGSQRGGSVLLSGAGRKQPLFLGQPAIFSTARNKGSIEAWVTTDPSTGLLQNTFPLRVSL